MFSKKSLHEALASVSAASVSTPLASVQACREYPSVPHDTGDHTIKPRKPKKGLEYFPSPLRPQVPARDRIRCWTAPCNNAYLLTIPPSHALNLLRVMLASLDIKTQENYGAGLLRFTQYCDSIGISEKDRFPASEVLLSSFVASWAGKIALSTVTGWLSGLHFWHNYQGAPWHGGNMLRMTTGGVKKMVPASSKRKKHPPVTIAHLHALVKHLSSAIPMDAAILATACVSFWGVCRLGELIPPGEALFDPQVHVTNDVEIHAGMTPNGIAHLHFHIPKTKADPEGADLHLTAIDDPSNPVNMLENHLHVNADVPAGAPLFAFLTPSGWSAITKAKLLTRCNEVWLAEGLPVLPGHAFRIGGATELLLRGTPPDVVMVQGHWKSKAFIDYWRRIDEILPLFISNSFTEARIALTQSTMNTYIRRNTVLSKS
jgi:hypothetical protein